MARRKSGLEAPSEELILRDVSTTFSSLRPTLLLMFKTLAQRSAFAAKTALKPKIVAPLFSRTFATQFTPSHEYVKIDGEIGTVGITTHAADALGDIVYVELPEIGTEVEMGESFGSVESVKAASDVYSPVSGEVVEVNSELENNPGEVNKSAMEGGWFMKLKVPFFPSLCPHRGLRAHK